MSHHAGKEDSVDKVSFSLEAGYRIANYKIDRQLGSGCTAEAYLVKEVPTGAERVLKIYDRFQDSEKIKNLHDFAHYCWFLEQVSDVGLLPRYSHMAHVFLDDEDGIGHYYMIQEYIAGEPFSIECSHDMVLAFCEKVERIHLLEYAVGDISPENLLISKGAIRAVDCNYGHHNKPYTDTGADWKAIRKLFGATFEIPSKYR